MTLTIWKQIVLSETIADGSAFVVCDHFGLDISASSLPYIASYNEGVFTPEMLHGIRVASLDMVLRLQEQE